MTLLKLKGDKVVGLTLNVSPDYQVKDDEVLVDNIPHVELRDNERGYIYYRNGKVEIEIKEKNNGN